MKNLFKKQKASFRTLPGARGDDLPPAETSASYKFETILLASLFVVSGMVLASSQLRRSAVATQKLIPSLNPEVSHEIKHKVKQDLNSFENTKVAVNNVPSNEGAPIVFSRVLPGVVPDHYQFKARC